MTLRRVVVLADESANWVVAGLRQLDRIALSLSEFAAAQEETAPIVICILWKPQVPPSHRWTPANERLANIVFTTDDNGQGFDLVVSTQLFWYRKSLPQLIEASRARGSRGERSSATPDHLWAIYSERLESLPRVREGAWEYIARAGEIDAIEKRFLRAGGKPQDGFVSRYLNRPISRTVTRLLLRYPITPNAWTLMTFPIVIVASIFLLNGSYWWCLAGLVLYQIFSILDGCDGEIARAKFLESDRGRRLDDVCDVLSNVLLVLGLGFGLSEQANVAGQHQPWLYIEGIVTAVLIAVTELYLAIRKPAAATDRADSLGHMLYPRHRQLVERSGLLIFGQKFASAVIQLTKRDVAVLFFVFLAAIGMPEWILHLLLAVTALSLGLALRARSR